MFREANRTLESSGFRFRDVARTWIYLPQLLDWYDEFNAARAQSYQEFGLLDGRRPVWLPASTGIQGASPLGHECMLDLLAVARTDGARADMEMLASPLQCEAYEYGSMFSRAVEVRDESVSRIFVSGTASIDRVGVTVHVGDCAAQVRCTLATVRELLAARGHDLGDVTHCVAFLKNRDHADEFRVTAADMGLDPGIAIQTVADVCRHDLLFELEVTAVRPL
jgi:enamine deaminase RidA (YjgF/YER057c/UK114 family)